MNIFKAKEIKVVNYDKGLETTYRRIRGDKFIPSYRSIWNNRCICSKCAGNHATSIVCTTADLIDVSTLHYVANNLVFSNNIKVEIVQ